MMLDAKSTFDDLVVQNASDAEQAERIFRNRLYRNLTSALAGTQEYMAAEKLYELHGDARFDLVVVDTPPTRNALDFIDAPKRLTRFLDNRLFRLLMVPTRASLRALSLATNALLRTISKVAGAEIVDDAVAFFRAFAGMEDGFRDRAAQVERLLADPGTAFVMVAAPQRDPAAEAAFFARRLTDSGLAVEALIVNRSHPSFGAAPEHWSLGDVPDGETARPWAELTRNIADFATIAQREANHVAELAREVAPAAVVRVPLFSSDVHDLGGLELVASHLVPAEPSTDGVESRDGSLTSPRPGR
jgi:anion-transporting  ArsA/GET3 family ATPase